MFVVFMFEFAYNKFFANFFGSKSIWRFAKLLNLNVDVFGKCYGEL